MFDLDGTLVDSLPDIVASFRYAFGAAGFEPPTETAVRAEIGAPLEAMYAVFAERERVPELVTAYREHYPRHFTDRTRPYPGVPGLLGELRARGYRLGVATTKRSAMARELVAAVGLDERLDWVQGTDDFPHKPAPDVILRTLEALGARGTWMVGDTRGDLLAGRAAGLRTYGVGWGTQPLAALREADPDELAPDLDRLLELT